MAEEEERVKTGRPPMFETVEELQEKIDVYFEKLTYQDKDTGLDMMRPATITGLALDLGFCSRQSLWEYGKKPAFTYAIARARMRVESSYEQHLLSKSSAGAVFALKNFGWADNVKVESNNTNVNTEMTAEEKQAAIDRVTNSLDEFKDYE